MSNTLHNGNILIEHLTGCDESLLVECDGHLLHREILDDWRRLVRAAAQAGFELCIASSYRSYDRQLVIWNEKARGLREVSDADDKPLDISMLDDDEKLFAILRWSALPGASRHHWGTDIDVYDKAAVPASYALHLNLAEVETGGLFAALHQWLDKQIAAGDSFDFYRPYTRKLSNDEFGINAERWHLSHLKTSARYEHCLSRELLYRFYEHHHEIELQSAILANFDCIYDNYIQR